MHVLYIHQYFATPHGTTGTRSYEFARRWIKAGHRVTILTSVAQLTENELDIPPRHLVTHTVVEGIDVIVLNVKYHQTMGYARRVWSFVCFMVLSSWFAVRLADVDMVYASSTPLTVGVPAILARWLRGRRYVFEVRDPWPDVPIELGALRSRCLIFALRVLERTIYSWAETVVTLSPGMTEVIASSVRGRTRIVEIPNGADIDAFTPDVDGATVRRERGWGDRFVCVHAGAMGQVNGVDCIVRAAQHFRDDTEVLFVVIGEGKEKPRLIAERDRLKLENLQIAPSVGKRDMPSILSAVDLCLMTVTNVPILKHNSANKFFDYLAAGKAIVLNYDGWQRELIESSGAGLGSQMGNEDEFCRNIATLKADKNRLREMGVHARKLAVERFAFDLLAAEAVKTLETAARL